MCPHELVITVRILFSRPGCVSFEMFEPGTIEGAVSISCQDFQLERAKEFTLVSLINFISFIALTCNSQICSSCYGHGQSVS